MTDELPISKNYKTILAAMQDRFGKDNVVYEPGMTYGLTDQWVGNLGCGTCRGFRQGYSCHQGY